MNKEMVYAALDEIHSQDLNHYNAYCPHCRRANRLSPKVLKRAAPNWEPGASTVEQPED
jgi:hypothetical protein